eukprot:99942-Pyramimonas_sp.AAC.1
MGVVIDPQLRHHVADNLRGEAQVAKGARKVKEEHRLRRQPLAAARRMARATRGTPDGAGARELANPRPLRGHCMEFWAR